MRERDCLKSKAIKSGLSEDWAKFKSMKNKVNYEIKHSKKSFVTESIQTNDGKNTKQVWKSIRNIIPSKGTNCNITCLQGDKGDVTEPKEMANMMNDYFANVGPSLAAKIPETPEVNPVHGPSFNSNMRRPDESFMFQPVSYQYVLDKLQSLSERKATGTDDLPAKLLKMAAHSIVEPITHIINLSLVTGIFPCAWKNARISPIYKGGDATDPGNYRPISILPVMSKIIERAVFDQMYPFMNDNEMLYDQQSGFRPKYSTLSALINITEDWYDAIDKGKFIGLVMLDLKKAFDTVDHGILLKKLKDFNLHESCIKWFNSYLSGRSHNTVINGIMSSSAKSICGIPQGSILGPLLFIMYINDLPLCTTHVKVSMYADDTALYAVSNDIDDLIAKINEDLANVNNWLAQNKLSLNVAKTEFMLMGSRQRLATIKDVDINVNINDVKLQQVHSCKHLGVIVDDNMTWSEQTKNIKKRVLPGLYMLRKCKGFLPAETLSLVFKSLVQPHIDYCDTIWSNCNVKDMDMIQMLQNRAAKIITGARWYDSSTNALSQLGWDCIRKRCIFHDNVTMYKIINDHAAPYLSMLSKFINLRSNERYNLRGYQMLSIPKPNTNYKMRSLSYRGAVSWNGLDMTCKKSRNVNHFKQCLRIANNVSES